MIVVHSPAELLGALSESVVTIGNFDGVHLGHQRLIGLAVQRARSQRRLSIVTTFEPHPLRFLSGRKTPPFITNLDRKLEHMAELGPEVALVLPFDRALASMEPEDFVARILVEGLHMKDLVIGYDYAFGKNRRGDHALLSRLGQEHGYTVEQLDPVIIHGAVVSSTRIRDLLQAGRVWEASQLLGRFYRLSGPVVRGAGRGATLLGFPTANVEPCEELVPLPGVYAALAELDSSRGQVLQAVVNIGVNPTFGPGQQTVEAHLLDFRGDLYGRSMDLQFVQRLRDEKKFSGPEELKARIAEDVALGRRVLSQVAVRG